MRCAEQPCQVALQDAVLSQLIISGSNVSYFTTVFRRVSLTAGWGVWQAQAEKYQFAIVAPDSYSWDKWAVPLTGADPTMDTWHAMARPSSQLLLLSPLLVAGQHSKPNTLYVPPHRLLARLSCSPSRVCCDGLPK